MNVLCLTLTCTPIYVYTFVYAYDGLTRGIAVGWNFTQQYIGDSWWYGMMATREPLLAVCHCTPVYTLPTQRAPVKVALMEFLILDSCFWTSAVLDSFHLSSFSNYMAILRSFLLAIFTYTHSNVLF